MSERTIESLETSEALRDRVVELERMTNRLKEERDLQKAVIDAGYVLITQLKEQIADLKAERDRLKGAYFSLLERTGLKGELL